MTKHLDWHELTDFTGGLWTASDWLVPANAAQTMQDCYALPGGGLRAFGKWSTHSTSGLTTTHDPHGIYIRTTGQGGALDKYLVTTDGTGVKRVYRWDGPGAATSWAQIFASAAIASGAGSMVTFVQYTLSGGTTNLYFNIAGGTDAGVWKYNYTTGAAPTRILDAAVAYVTTHQNRLVAGGTGSRIYWTDEGTETFDASNFLDVEPEKRSAETAFLIPYSPSDLLVGKVGAPMVLIQGDLEDPIVRAMSGSTPAVLAQIPVETKGGVAFRSTDHGVFLTREGADFEHVSPQLSDYDAGYFYDAGSSAGAMTYKYHFLFTPGGFIRDDRTGAWFKTSAFGGTTAGVFMTTSPVVGAAEQGVYVLKRNPIEIRFLEPVEGAMTRVQTYTWKSAPLRHPEGRQIVIREVQVYAKSYEAGSTVQVTVNGTAHTTTIGVGRHSVRALFKQFEEVLDIQITCTAPTLEAPSIETVRIGTLPGRITT